MQNQKQNNHYNNCGLPGLPSNMATFPIKIPDEQRKAMLEHIKKLKIQETLNNNANT